MKLDFIEDREVNLEKDDLLGTQAYANTLSQIIKEAQPPFTIGLFGGWGSGKSSIIKTIEEDFNTDKKSKIEVFVYDSWKYSKDPFRRTFISEFKNHFGIKGTDELDSFYEDKHEEIKGKTGLSDHLWVYILLLLVPLISINAVPLVEGKEFEYTTFFISICISAITFFVAKTFVQYKISITKPKIFAPEEFESIFKEFINRIVGNKKSVWRYVEETVGIKKKVEKIVIVIDNVDRCHKDLAFELLLTIKNFLEQKNVIFVVPIDETQVKNHIQGEMHDGNEFLRKLFNTTLTIKKFSENDLFDFAKKLNSKHELDFPDDVISLISQEFSKNPRKIIQFLNVLQTEVALAEQQEREKKIPKGTITKNLPFLTKILLIREEWSDVYEVLKENHYLLNDINEDLKEDKDKIIIANIALNESKRNFFSRTRHISTSNVEAFFTNKDAFPDVPDELYNLVISQDWKSIKTYLEKEVITFEKLAEFIDKTFDDDILKKRLWKTSGVNIFSLIFKISSDTDYSETFREYYYGNYKFFGEIKANLNSTKISDLLLYFEPGLLLNFAKTDLQTNKKLLEEIIKFINTPGDYDDDDEFELLKKFIEAFKDDSSYLKKINTKFSDILRTKPSLFNEFRDLLKESLVVESLIRPSLLEEFIDLLEEPVSEDVEDKLEIIKHYNLSKGLSQKLLKLFVEKIIGFMDIRNSLGIMSFWFKDLKGLIIKLKDDALKNRIIITLEKKYTFLCQQYASSWNKEEYKLTLKDFLDVANESYIAGKDSKIQNWLNYFFTKKEDTEIPLYINRLHQRTINSFHALNWPFSQQVIDKFNQISEWKDKVKIAETLNLMLNKTTDKNGLNETQIQSILNNYINILDGNTSEQIEEWLIKGWLSSVAKNEVVKDQLEVVVKGLSTNKKLDIIEIIRDIDKDLLKDCVREIITGVECDNLEDTFNTLNNANVDLTLIKSGVKEVLKTLQKEGYEEYFECFLNFVTKNKWLDQNIISTIVSKIKPFLSDDERPKEEKIFALHILERIDIANKNQKELIKSLLKNLDDGEFNEEEKSLFEKVKKKSKEREAEKPTPKAKKNQVKKRSKK